MTEWLDWVMDGSVFVTHDQCGAWTPGLVRASVFASVVFSLTYFIVSGILARVYLIRRGIQHGSTIFLWFAVVFLFCGFTHVLNVTAFYWPAYRFYVVVTNAGALISVAAVCRLPTVVAYFLRAPTIEQYAEASQLLAAALAREKEARAVVQQQVDTLKIIVGTKAFTPEEQAKINAIIDRIGVSL